MKTVNMRAFMPACAVKNEGILREWTVCSYAGIERTKHDNVPYDKGSDVSIGNRHISIKASSFTLMSGTRCEGLTDFDAIWALYESKTHSNEFCYVTKDFTAYFMDIDEFKTFVYEFCHVDKDSTKNGGHKKIKCRSEDKKMLHWLEERAS